MENLRKISLNYGLFLGIFTILFTTILYSVDISLLTSSWIGMVNLVILTIFGSAAALKYKKSTGGFISFKEAFSAFIITVVVGYFLSTIYSILLFNVIDTDAKTIITENVIKSTVSMMEKFGAKAADINKMVADMQESDSFGVWGQFKGFLFGLILYSIIGLVAALIIKRERPQSN